MNTLTDMAAARLWFDYLRLAKFRADLSATAIAFYEPWGDIRPWGAEGGLTFEALWQEQCGLFQEAQVSRARKRVTRHDCLYLEVPVDLRTDIAEKQVKRRLQEERLRRHQKPVMPKRRPPGDDYLLCLTYADRDVVDAILGALALRATLSVQAQRLKLSTFQGRLRNEKVLASTFEGCLVDFSSKVDEWLRRSPKSQADQEVFDDFLIRTYGRVARVAHSGYPIWPRKPGEKQY
jgi:hypothetical protein